MSACSVDKFTIFKHVELNTNAVPKMWLFIALNRRSKYLEKNINQCGPTYDSAIVCIPLLINNFFFMSNESCIKLHLHFSADKGG